MIAMSIMAVALSSIAAGLLATFNVNEGAKDRAKAQQLARILFERLQGCAWSDLMGTGVTWAALRPMSTPSHSLGSPTPPMQAISGPNGFAQNGLLDVASGLRSPKLYLDYFTQAPLDAGMAATSIAQWKASYITTANRLLSAPSATTGTDTDAIVIRITVTYEDRNSTPSKPILHSYELYGGRCK
jgi:hypothetical protein